MIGRKPTVHLPLFYHLTVHVLPDPLYPQPLFEHCPIAWLLATYLSPSGLYRRSYYLPTVLNPFRKWGNRQVRFDGFEGA